jgi:sugar transferase EpsL
MAKRIYPHYGKRWFDLVVAASAWLLLSPLMLLVMLLIRLHMGRPVWFRQRRPGRHGRAFELLKLRTMTNGRDARGKLLPDAQRLTPLGRVLRQTSLDELPELFNVLSGDMSLVGPRPLLMAYLGRYSREQMRRHEVKPGITGWAQVNGRNTAGWEDRFDLDVWYVDHLSFRLDLKIMALTLAQVLHQEGINQPGEATMREFMGNPGG